GEHDANLACDNGIDDDADGKIDFNINLMMRDPGCDAPTDASERGSLACDNGVDDDGDGFSDYNLNPAVGDPGCVRPTDVSERGTDICDNGNDDDNDGYTDFRADGTGDLGCSAPDDTDERCPGGGCPACDDAANNDNDFDNSVTPARPLIDFRLDGTGDPE